MRLPGDYSVSETQDCTGKSFITYAGWNSKFSKDIPLPMQRAIIEPYCVKNKISYTSYEFENEHMDWQPGLEYYINEQPDGIVLCSIYCLTDDVARRSELLKLALDKGVELHFANELLSLKTQEDLDKIETYLNFAVPKKGLYVWEE
jgi:sporadic carbohydrate cluster protein (TIGR04323 family)